MTGSGWGLAFHHFGLAARDLPRALAVVSGLGYRCGEAVRDPLQKVVLVWCEHPEMPAIEIVTPGDEQGPLDNLLTRNAEVVYHLCYRSKSIAESVAAMKADGIRVVQVAGPTPAVLFGGRRVAFYQVRGLGLVEIVEEA